MIEVVSQDRGKSHIVSHAREKSVISRESRKEGKKFILLPILLLVLFEGQGGKEEVRR